MRRNQERRQFAPENVPDKNVWFHVDVPLMRGMAGGKPDPKLDTFFLDADAAPNPGGVPVGGQTRLDIPNDHLQYAITWFLLALALAGVYLAYHWENGRLTVAGRTKEPDAMIANDPYAELERRFARLSAVNRASAILNWDRSTMMPAGASEDRADQLATLGVIAHGMIAAPDMPELLSRAEEGPRDLDRWRAANLREMRRLWVHESALPADLVEARTRASLGLRDGLARGQEERRLQVAAADAQRGAGRDAPRRRGQGRRARHLALRRAARRVRAGRPRGAHRRAVRRAARLPARPAGPRHGAPGAAPASRSSSTGRFRSSSSASWARS